MLLQRPCLWLLRILEVEDQTENGCFDQGGSSISWILGTAMMATQLSVADHHHGYLSDSSCQDVSIKEPILIFWYVFWGLSPTNPVTKLRS